MFQRLIVILLLSVATAFAQRGDSFDVTKLAHWHQWRGPNADGVAHDANPPLLWSPSTNIKWKRKLPGTGSATPVVWGDRIFVAVAEETTEPASDPPKKLQYQIPSPPTNLYRFALLCVDRETGDVVWDKTATKAVPHEGHHKSHTYAASSPITNGRQVFVSFGSRGIFAFDMDGSLLWQRDLGDMKTRRGWGEGASPALHGDTLVVNWDHEGDSFIVAFDTKTGKPKWKVERDEPTSWATPLIVSDGNKTHVIVSATNKMTGYDISDGDVLWSCEGLSINCVPSPVTVGGVVYCMSNYRQSAAFAIPLSARGDAAGSVLWKHEGGTPYCPSPLLHQKLLYFTASNNSIMTVLDSETGKRTCDPFRLPGIRSIYGSPLAAGEHIFVTGRSGNTVVLSAGKQPKVVSTNSLGEPVDSSPIALGNKLFIRGRSHLYCLGAD